MKKFYDTSSVLEGYSDLHNVIIATVTLEELENIKTSRTRDDEIKFKARKAVKNIIKHNVQVVFNEEYGVDSLGLSNDEVIIATCAEMSKGLLEPVQFYSEDLLCRLIAERKYGLTATSLENTEKQFYSGYILIEGNTEEINTKYETLDTSALYTNEYVIFHDTDLDEWKEMRFDGESLVGLKLPSFKKNGFNAPIKAKNSLQRCALDALNNSNITTVAILGTAGSGKSFLAMQMGLYLMQSTKNQIERIVAVREASGEGKEIGFLKGDFEDKTKLFFKPLEQQLEAKDYQLQQMVTQGKLGMIIPFYAKGLTWDNTYVECTEAEDFSTHQIKLIGTRVGQNSKIVFEGDYKQSNINKSITNPLIEMCEELKGNPNFACIVLDEDVRSETSKMFASLFS